MARPRKFTAEHWTDALRLYVTDGPTAASARTGIDKGNLTRRAKAMGLTTVVTASTHAATEAVAARRALKREHTILQMYGFISEALEMTTKSRVIYVGQHKRPVTITGLMPKEYLAVAAAVAKMAQTLDSELGWATDR